MLNEHPPLTAASENQGLHRVLNERHVTMLAIGGAIGSGLFLNSGKLIATAGPFGALFSYLTCGVLVYFLMHSLGELTAKFPSSGGFSFYGRRFVDPGFGFAIGWNYWWNWAITVSVDILSACILMQYWFPNLSQLLCCFIFFSVILALNLISVKGFCEAEYGAALLKVLAIIIFLALGIALLGKNILISRSLSSTFHHWTIGDLPFFSKWVLFLRTLIFAAFAFQGTELVGVTAGESKNPSKTLPLAVRQVFMRILFFYLFSTILIGTLIPQNEPSLLKNELSDVMVSPFTLVFERFLGPLAAHVMNLVVLSAVISSANSGLYASARSLYGLAIQKMAPRCFTKTTSRGIPIFAICATAAVSLLALLLGYCNPCNIYMVLTEASSIAGFIAWFGIALAHYRFRKGWIKQGHSVNDLPFYAKFFPFGPICVLALSLCVLMGSGVELVITDFTWMGFLTTYLSLFLFGGMWWGYRWLKSVRTVSYEEMDFSSTIS